MSPHLPDLNHKEFISVSLMAFTLYLTPFVNISSPPEMVFLLKYLFFCYEFTYIFSFYKGCTTIKGKIIRKNTSTDVQRAGSDLGFAIKEEMSSVWTLINTLISNLRILNYMT